MYPNVLEMFVYIILCVIFNPKYTLFIYIIYYIMRCILLYTILCTIIYFKYYYILIFLIYSYIMFTYTFSMILWLIYMRVAEMYTWDINICHSKRNKTFSLKNISSNVSHIQKKTVTIPSQSSNRVTPEQN